MGGLDPLLNPRIKSFLKNIYYFLIKSKSILGILHPFVRI
jgi:hypothetical protein